MIHYLLPFFTIFALILACFSIKALIIQHQYMQVYRTYLVKILEAKATNLCCKQCARWVCCITYQIDAAVNNQHCSSYSAPSLERRLGGGALVYGSALVPWKLMGLNPPTFRFPDLILNFDSTIHTFSKRSKIA